MCSLYNNIRERIYSSNHPLIGYKDEHKRLLEIIKRTAEKGESNSLLILGRRGCGKTQLLKAVMTDLRGIDEVKENLLQVHLNGLLQTDDRAALKEITRQLKLETQASDKVFASFAENLRFLLDVLRTGDRSRKSILFILEEFDLFAQHRNQTLLYNLFDIAQQDHTPICVVGVTCRLDVVELLEKRVKSRFSHRQIHLCSAAPTFAAYLQAFKTLLTFSDTADKKNADHRTEIRKWNKHVAEVATDSIIDDCLRQLYSFNTSIRTLKQILVCVVVQMDPECPQLDPIALMDSLCMFRQDAKSNLLKGLSILELTLITAMVKLDSVYEGEALNIEMVYNEYAKFARTRSATLYPKAVVMKAVDQLLGLELVSPLTTVSSNQRVGGGPASQQQLPGYRPLFCLVDKVQLLNCLESCSDCPTDLKQWANATHLFT